jgi:succinate dehydrogenase/fumarate reductase flavoprotein subunit
MQVDVIVVGAGLAGMAAALAAEEAGAEVLLVDRGPIGTGTNSAMSNAAFSGPVSAERAEEYVDLVLGIGKHLNRVSCVRRIAREAPAAIAFLESLGLEIATSPGQWMIRSSTPETIPGVSLVRRVAEVVSRKARIRVERGTHAQALRTGSNRIVGVSAMNLDGDERELRASVVVLACGGAGAIYARNDNQAAILGQGYHLAARAGLDLWDMEFVQCYPIVLDEPDMPMMMIYPPYPPEARLIGPMGEDVVQKYGLGNINQAIIRKRDAFSALLLEEAKAGPVCMDLRAVPEERWGVHPLSLLKRFKAECQRRPIRISPAVHFCMGGVRTDEEGQTDLEGLFACGEMVWGLHGANRMGGNALMECLVTGRIAGNAAANCARRMPPVLDGPVGSTANPAPGASRADLPAIRERIQAAAWRYAGVVRSAEGMTAGLSEAESISAELRNARTDTPKERILRADLLSAVFTLRAILTAGQARLESRGAFIRSDYPEEDNIHWLKNSRLAWDPTTDQFHAEFVPAEAQ